jgi:outer membrane protein assembly factor BamA
MKAYRSILILISNFSIALTLLSADSIFAQRTTGKYDGLSYKRSIVNKIRLEGVKSFDKSEIKELLFTKSNHWYNVFKKRVFSKSNVNLDAATIKRFYARRGFLKTDVQSGISYLDDNKTDVTFYIFEGPRTYLTAIELRGGLEAINTKFGPVLQTLKIGAPVNDEEILSGAYKLRDLYADNGYPYTIISREYNFDQDSAQAGLTYAIAESVFTVNGLSQTVNPIISRPYIVRREIVARPEKMYRQKDVIESEQRLYSTGLFKFVSLRRNDSTAVIVNDTCHVGFNLGLSERKLYFTNFGLGLGNTRDYFDLVLRSYGQLGVRNIAGT